MVTFLFKDVVTTNIKILGEVAAVGAFIGAACLTFSFVFDTNLYNASTGTAFSTISGLSGLPMQGLTNLFAALKLDYLTEVLNNLSSWTMASGQNFTGDMLWNINDLFLVAGAFVNVALGLAYLYVNLAIYHFLYTMVSNFIKWIQSPSLPIAMKTK
jgi:hypothetical protein